MADFYLTTSATTGGSVTVPAGDNPHTIELGVQIVITATASAGYQFTNWEIVSGGITIPVLTNAFALLTPNSGTTGEVKAHFAFIPGHLFPLPTINNLACGVVKSYLIVSAPFSGMIEALPTKQVFLNIGDIKESIDMEVGFTDIDQVDVTVAEDYSIISEGFWHKLINENPTITVEILFSLMEGANETFLFRGTVYRQDTINTEFYLDEISDTPPTAWVRGLQFKLTSSFQLLQNVTMADLDTECLTHQVVCDWTGQDRYVVPVGAVIASMVKLGFGQTYDLTVCINNSSDIRPRAYASPNRYCNWDLAGIPSLKDNAVCGFFDATKDFAFVNRYASAYDLLKQICFVFGVIPRLTFGNASGYIDGTFANNLFRLEFNSRGRSATRIYMDRLESSSFVSQTLRIIDTVRITDQRYPLSCAWWYNNVLGKIGSNPLPNAQFNIDGQIDFATFQYDGDDNNRTLIVWDSVAAAYNQFCWSGVYWNYNTGAPVIEGGIIYAIANYYYYRFSKLNRLEYTRSYGQIHAFNDSTHSQMWLRTLCSHVINDGTTERTFYATEVSKNLITNKSTVVWVEE
jgi:hypothetical protein